MTKTRNNYNYKKNIINNSKDFGDPSSFGEETDERSGGTRRRLDPRQRTCEVAILIRSRGCKNGGTGRCKWTMTCHPRKELEKFVTYLHGWGKHGLSFELCDNALILNVIQTPKTSWKLYSFHICIPYTILSLSDTYLLHISLRDCKQLSPQ
jgi:hypothetical protein